MESSLKQFEGGAALPVAPQNAVAADPTSASPSSSPRRMKAVLPGMTIE